MVLCAGLCIARYSETDEALFNSLQLWIFVTSERLPLCHLNVLLGMIRPVFCSVAIPLACEVLFVEMYVNVLFVCLFCFVMLFVQRN